MGHGVPAQPSGAALTLPEWENHTQSHSQTCRQSCWSREGLVCAGVCAGSRWQSGAALSPSPGAPKGIDFPSPLFGLLINRSCSSLGVTWQAKEIYGHCPASPVSPAVCRGDELPALSHLPQSLGSPQRAAPQDRLPRAVPFCSKLPKRKRPDTHHLLTRWLGSPGRQKNLVGFHFHRQKVPIKSPGCCARPPSLAWDCGVCVSLPGAPQNSLWGGGWS